jgi:hypothetical protein
MPIRLNLFAEDQALEALRRRDPVKRAIIVGVVLVIGMLGWASILMFKTMAAKNEVSIVDGRMKAQTNAYLAIVNSEKKLADTTHKLQALHILATNRFLNGTLMDALQRNVVDNVQVTHLRVNQTYIYHEEVKPKDEEDKRAPKPATVDEKISLALDATDTSMNGEGATHFQNVLAAAPYFQRTLARTNGFRLKSIGAPQVDASGKSFSTFTLEAYLPEKTR